VTTREEDLVRYALAYLATGDGRRARSHTATVLSKDDMQGVRAITNEMRGEVFKRARHLAARRVRVVR
jgi:hypothetical protein